MNIAGHALGRISKSAACRLMAWAGIPARAHRPMPKDFPEVFARVGWDGIEFEMRAHKDTIKRWMIDYGEARLQRQRRKHLEAVYQMRGYRVPGVRPGRKLSSLPDWVIRIAAID
jgi:hypothetical protein